MSRIANIHCHFMNSSHVPKEYFNCFENTLINTFRSFIEEKYFWYKGKTIDNYITRGQ